MYFRWVFCWGNLGLWVFLEEVVNHSNLALMKIAEYIAGVTSEWTLVFGEFPWSFVTNISQRGDAFIESPDFWGILMLLLFGEKWSVKISNSCWGRRGFEPPECLLQDSCCWQNFNLSWHKCACSNSWLWFHVFDPYLGKIPMLTTIFLNCIESTN